MRLGQGRLVFGLAVCCAAALNGCGDDDETASSTGGNANAGRGGSAGSGGKLSSLGGKSNSGGRPATGGTPNGGAPSGGTQAEGGANGGEGAAPDLTGGMRSNGGTSNGGTSNGGMFGTPGGGGAGGFGGEGGEISGGTAGTQSGGGVAGTSGGSGGAANAACPSNAWHWEDAYPESDGGKDVIALWGTSTTDVWESRGKHGLIHHFNGTAWSDVPLSTGNVVESIMGTAANDVWAVGTGGLIAHYDGTQWSCATPVVNAALHRVWATAANDVWAVGASEFTAAGAWVPPATVLHWNGSTWARNTLTWSSASTSCSFVGVRTVWGSGANDVWVVYDRACTGSLGSRRVTSRWNGSIWTEMFNENCSLGGTCVRGGWSSSATNAILINQASSPGQNPGLRQWNGTDWSYGGPTQDFSDLWGASANDIWFAGTDKSQHWNGATFDDNLPAAAHVSGTSATNVWLYGPGGNRRHWNGSAWSDFSTSLSAPARGVGSVDVFGVDSDHVWAVDTTGRVLRHQGNAWVGTGSPSGLTRVWASNPTDVWAVGGSDSVHHFDGQTWTQTSTALGVNLNAVWGTSATDIWAVGDATLDAGITPRYHTTAVHFDGVNWQRVGIEAPNAGTTAPNNLVDVSGSSSTNVWAISAGAKFQWNGATWTRSDGGGARVWVAGPNSTDVYVSTTQTLISGSGPTAIWTVATTTVGDVFMQSSNGTTATPVVAGFDNAASVIVPTALWVGAHDVYVVGSSGITVRMMR